MTEQTLDQLQLQRAAFSYFLRAVNPANGGFRMVKRVRDPPYHSALHGLRLRRAGEGRGGNASGRHDAGARLG